MFVRDYRLVLGLFLDTNYEVMKRFFASTVFLALVRDATRRVKHSNQSSLFILKGLQWSRVWMATELSGTVYPSNWKKRAFLESENDSIRSSFPRLWILDGTESFRFVDPTLISKRKTGAFASKVCGGVRRMRGKATIEDV